MKKITALLLMTFLMLALFTGCSKPAPAAPAADAPSEPAAVPEATAEPNSDDVTDKDGLLKLMGGSTDAMKKGLSYDYEVTAGNQTMLSRYSFKGENVRMQGLDESNPSLTITKGKDIYIINPLDKTGFKMSSTGDADANPTGEVKPEENMDTESLNITGKEDVNGEPCYIVETKNTVDGSGMKMWIHRKYGIMMKMESGSAEEKLLITVKNLKIGDVPDSDFEIPADIKIMEMPALPQ